MGVSWVNFWMHRLFEVRGKQSGQQRGGHIDVVRPDRCSCGCDLNCAKPALVDLADGRYRTFRLRHGDEQEDGVDHGAGLHQTGKSPALPARPVE